MTMFQKCFNLSPQCCNGSFPPGGIDEDEAMDKLFPEIKKFNLFSSEKKN